MNITLWIFQIILASACLFSGICKTYFSEKKLFEMGQTGIDGLSPTLIKFIGVSELLLAMGLILPWLLNIYPVLTPISAFLFGIIMILASIIHFKRAVRFDSKKEQQNAINNIIILGICIFIVIFRLNQLLTNPYI